VPADRGNVGSDAATPPTGFGRVGLAAVLSAALLATAVAGAEAADIQWRGLLDLVASEHTDAYALNTLTHKDNPWDAYRLRVYAESQVDDHLQVLGQIVYNDGSGVYVDGAYVILTPWAERDLRVMGGKLPWVIGTFAPRTYSNKNPLIGTPLLYQYHTSLLWHDIPPNADALLAAAGTGQTGVRYSGFSEGPGMPIVDDGYWDVGIILTGSQRPIEYSAGVTAGTPGWGSTAGDDNSGKTMLGRLGFTPTPALRLGISGAYGPYLLDALDPKLPPGHDVNDYHQQLLMADLQVLVGHAELYAEGARNRWETPTVGDLDVDAGYVELKYAWSSGLYLAGRWDTEQFGKIRDSGGVEHPWDWNVTRLEAGLGYRVTRDATAKLAYQRTQLETGDPADRYQDQSLFGAQLSVGF
jgi:hypothetical protein